MSLYEWLLALHMLSAFILIAGVVATVTGVLAGEPTRRALAVPAAVGSALGGLAVLVFGIWLVVEVDGYEILDTWIVLAIVLWVIGGVSGSRAGRSFRPGGPAMSAIQARTLAAVNAVAAVLLLIDMIWKPGAV